eukprot:715094-Amphidinium_carterae.2
MGMERQLEERSVKLAIHTSTKRRIVQAGLGDGVTWPQVTPRIRKSKGSMIIWLEDHTRLNVKIFTRHTQIPVPEPLERWYKTSAAVDRDGNIEWVQAHQWQRDDLRFEHLSMCFIFPPALWPSRQSGVS